MKLNLNNLKKLYAKHGFIYTFVSEDEHEDGIGAVVGQNFVKNGVFYSSMDAAREIGLALVRCGSAEWKLTD